MENSTMEVSHRHSIIAIIIITEINILYISTMAKLFC